MYETQESETEYQDRHAETEHYCPLCGETVETLNHGDWHR